MTMLAGTLISDFHHPEVLENIFLLFKPPSQWYSVIEAQAETNIFLKKSELKVLTLEQMFYQKKLVFV